MTKHFSKWASKQDLSLEDLSNALDEIINGTFEANSGGSVFKGKERAEVQEQSPVINEKIERFSFMGFQKMKANTTTQFPRATVQPETCCPKLLSILDWNINLK